MSFVCSAGSPHRVWSQRSPAVWTAGAWEFSWALDPSSESVRPGNGEGMSAVQKITSKARPVTQDVDSIFGLKLLFIMRDSEQDILKFRVRHNYSSGQKMAHEKTCKRMMWCSRACNRLVKAQLSVMSRKQSALFGTFWCCKASGEIYRNTSSPLHVQSELAQN